MNQIRNSILYINEKITNMEKKFMRETDILGDRGIELLRKKTSENQVKDTWKA
jgi:hypothetical protein